MGSTAPLIAGGRLRPPSMLEPPRPVLKSSLLTALSCSVLVRAADVLGQLPQQISRSRQVQPSTVAAYLSIACMLSVTCSQLSPAAQLQPAQSRRLCSFARMMVTSGTNAVQHGAAQQRQGTPGGVGWQGLLLSSQYALEYSMQLAASIGHLPGFAACVASPALLSGWLAASAAGLELLSLQRTSQSELFAWQHNNCATAKRASGPQCHSTCSPLTLISDCTPPKSP